MSSLVTSSRKCAPARLGRCGGFSLVEVTLAIGIVSFAMLALLGAVPVGLSTMRQAADHTVESQIVRQISAEALYTPFSKLATNYAGATLCFSDEGLALTNADPATARYRASVAMVAPAYPGSSTASDLTNSLWTMHITLVTAAGGQGIATNYYNIQVPSSGD